MSGQKNFTILTRRKLWLNLKGQGRKNQEWRVLADWCHWQLWRYIRRKRHSNSETCRPSSHHTAWWRRCGRPRHWWLRLWIHLENVGLLDLSQNNTTKLRWARLLQCNGLYFKLKLKELVIQSFGKNSQLITLKIYLLSSALKTLLLDINTSIWFLILFQKSESTIWQ